MTATLRLVGDDDERRGQAVHAFLSRFEQEPNTQRTMHSALRTIVRLFPEHPANEFTFPWELASDPIFFDEVQRRVAARYMSATASKLMSVLRQLLKAMSRRGVIDAELLWSTLDGAPKVNGRESEPTRGLLTDELRSMLAACRRDPNVAVGCRDAAMLALMAATGARRSEVAAIERHKLELADNLVEFPVKGGGWRRAALHPAAIEYLELWLTYGVTGDHLFCHVQKNGLVLAEEGISDKAVWKRVTKRRDQAGMDPRITPHSFRRWFVTSLLEAGVDLLTVTRAVGHRHPSTTQRYDRREERVLRKVVLSLELPTIEEVDAVDDDVG